MAAAAGAVAALLALTRRVVVTGASMEPTLQPGDRALAWRWARPRVGSVVVVEAPSGLVVKRLVAIDPQGNLEVRGDNPAASTDSRHHGPLPPTSLRGRLVYCYYPPHRAGAIGEPGGRS